MPLSYPSPPLTDGTALLRPWTLADVPEVVRCCDDPHLSRWLPGVPPPYPPDHAVALLAAPGPALADEGVGLRPWTPADAAEIVRCANDELVSRFIPHLPVPYTSADADAYIARTVADSELNLAVSSAETSAVLGSVGVGI